MGDGTHLNRDAILDLLKTDQRYRETVADYVLAHRTCPTPVAEHEHNNFCGTSMRTGVCPRLEEKKARDDRARSVAEHEQEVRAEAIGADNQEVRDLLALAHAGELANHLLCIHDNALGRPMDPWSEVAAEVWLLVQEVRRLQRAIAARTPEAGE